MFVLERTVFSLQILDCRIPQSMYRFLFFVCFLIVFMGLSACDVMETTPDDTDLLIGVAIPQTGIGGVIGQSVTSGIHLAIQELETLSNLNIALAFIDTRATVMGTEDAYRQFIGMENLPVIIGPLTSTNTEAIIPVLNENDIISLGPTSSKQGLSAQSENLFRLSLTNDRIIPTGISTSKANLDFKNVATLYNSGDAFSVASNESIVDELQAYNDITVVIQASYSAPEGALVSEDDVSPHLDNILSTTPPVDAIFLSGLSPDHDVILPSAYRKGNSAPFIIPLLSIASVHTINSREPGAAEGAVTFSIWLSSSPNSLSKTFVESYMNNFGAIPDDWATRGYAATSLLIEAFRRSPAYDYSSVRNSLAGIRDFPTILGSFSFDHHGDAVYDPVVAVVRNNDFLAWPTVSR